VAATNKDLKQLVKEGRFRDDLFYRLNVVHIELPPLRKRKEDLEKLISVFINTKCAEFGIKPKSLSPEAFNRLESYDYPGNIRELSNIIERALILSKGTVIKPAEVNLPKQELSSEGIVPTTKIDIENGFKSIEGISQKLEEELIREAIRAHASMSNTELAELLGTTRRVLEARIKAYGIEKA
jgi:DNA-binding NtrC family response regulator